jgi:excisionase family DNA binding protein
MLAPECAEPSVILIERKLPRVSHIPRRWSPCTQHLKRSDPKGSDMAAKSVTPRRPADGVEGLDVREVAYLVGCHPNTARKLVKDGDLPSVRLGSRVIVPRAAVMRLLAGQPA